MSKGGIAEAGGPPTTTWRPRGHPLARFKTPRGRWTNVIPTMITAHLKAMVKILLGTHLGFTHKYVSAWSLWAASAMALLCSRVGTDIISLIGRCRSNEMMRYLHVQAEPIMKNIPNATDNDLAASTFIIITFITQKNGVRGE